MTIVNLIILLPAPLIIFISYLWAQYKLKNSIDSINSRLDKTTDRIAQLETTIRKSATTETGEIFPRCMDCIYVVENSLMDLASK